MRRPVCVPPWTKGLTPPLSHRQGGSDPFSSHCLTKTLLIGCDIRRGRSPNVPAEFSTRCHPTLQLFDSWSFMFPPHKHSSPATVQPVRVSATCECQHCSTIQFKLTFPPCCSIAFLPNETIALTENPSSKCVWLVGSRLRVKGAMNKGDSMTPSVANCAILQKSLKKVPKNCGSLYLKGHFGSPSCQAARGHVSRSWGASDAVGLPQKSSKRARKHQDPWQAKVEHNTTPLSPCFFLCPHLKAKAKNI